MSLLIIALICVGCIQLTVYWASYRVVQSLVKHISNKDLESSVGSIFYIFCLYFLGISSIVLLNMMLFSLLIYLSVGLVAIVLITVTLYVF